MTHRAMRASRALFAASLLLSIVGCCLAFLAPAAAQSESKVATLKSVWFTDREFPPSYQMFSGPPEQYYGPSKSEFLKESGKSVKLVVIMSEGDSHQFEARRIDPKGKKTSSRWSVDPLPRVRTWRVTTRAWAMTSLAPGEHTVELIVDGKPGGTYKFTVR